MKLISIPWLKAFSALFINMSAAWYGLVLIAPQFTLKNQSVPLLTINFIYGTVFLLITVFIEKELKERI